MDFKALASNLGIDDDDFIELAELLVTTSNDDLKKVEQGLANNDPEQVAAASHSIKGAAGNMGFEDISAMAAEMEQSGRKGSLDGLEAKIALIKKELATISEAI